MSSIPTEPDSPEKESGNPDKNPVPKRTRFLIESNRPTTGVIAPKPTYRTVLITGAGRGLGRALALELARLGYCVIAVSRSQQLLDSLLRALKRRSPLRLPYQHRTWALDVKSDLQVEELAEGMNSQKVYADLIVNSAGIINENNRMWEVPAEEFDEVIDTNISGTANILRHFIRWMVDRQHGTIVNISSGWGSSSAGLVAPYCASKWAVEGLTRSVARECPPGVIVVALNPGLVDTRLLRLCFGDQADDYQKPSDWAPEAARKIISLKQEDHGTSVTIDPHIQY